MANGQEQQPSIPHGSVQVSAFEERAKEQLLEVFTKARAQTLLEVKQQGFSALLLALRWAGSAFLLAVLVFCFWLIWGSPCSDQILAFLAVIVALLIALLSILVAFFKFVGAATDA